MRSVLDMHDEDLMCHLEELHPGDLRLKFQVEPGRTERYLAAPELWRTYHDTLHRLYPNNYDHTHEVAMERMDGNVKWKDRPEDIWVMARVGDGDKVADAFVSEEAARKAEQRGDYSWGVEAVKVTLHRPSLQPIYGGPTLLEALWSEMDRLMEALMTGQTADDECGRKGHHGVPIPYDDDTAPCEHEDNGDKYRAQELAWVIAIVTNAYDPSVDSVRAEAMRRWNESQEAA